VCQAQLVLVQLVLVQARGFKNNFTARRVVICIHGRIWLAPKFFFGFLPLIRYIK